MKLRVENREKTLEFPPTQRDWERMEISFYPPHMWNEFLFLSFLFSPPDVTQTEKNDLVKGETQTTCQDRLEREDELCSFLSISYPPWPHMVTVDCQTKTLGYKRKTPRNWGFLSLFINVPRYALIRSKLMTIEKSRVQNSSLCGRRRKPEM